MPAEQSAPSLPHIPTFLGSSSRGKNSGSTTLPSTCGSEGRDREHLDHLPAGRKEEKSRSIGEFGEKQPPGSLGMEPAEKTGLRNGVLRMRSWERGFRAVYGAAATFPPPVPAGPCHPQRGWMSLHAHPWGQPSLRIGQGYGAGPAHPIPSHPHLPCAAALRAMQEDKATVPVPIRALLLLGGHHLQGCDIHRLGMGGWSWGGSCLGSQGLGAR